MAVTTGSVASSYIGTTIIEDTDANDTVETAASSGGTLYQVYISNTNNSGQVYIKLYEATAGSVTLGTTPPSFIFPCLAANTRQFDFPTGLSFASNLSFACTTEPGTAGTTAPTNDVLVRLTIG